MKLHKIFAIATLTGLLAIAQQSPAPPKRPAPAAAPASPVDNVIKLLKGKMSEALIIRSLQNQKPYNLSPEEMGRLKDAGASDNLIMAIMDPASATAPAPAPAPVPLVATAAPASTADCPAPAAVSLSAKDSKRRLAVQPFEYSAVKTNVVAVFGNDMNIGQGIRAMLTAKMGQSKSVRLLERESLKVVTTEQDLGATNRVKQGSKAKIGGILGADAILLGDIVIFGRDDKGKSNNAGGVIRALPGPFGAIGGAIHDSKKTDKAVVAINLRIVDAETGEVLATSEARGESSRTSTDWGGMLAGYKPGTGAGAGGAGQSMTSSNFAETIIGEATQNAVNQIAAFIDKEVPTIGQKERQIEGKVANVTGCILILTVGGNDGILVGDRFEIHKIIEPIIDPDTKEVIDARTEKVGDLIISNVRDKTSSGQYGGQAISMTYPHGYAARLVTQ